MALVKCPKCGNTISDLSTQCVHCGFAIGEFSASIKEAGANIGRLINQKFQDYVNMPVYRLQDIFRNASRVVFGYFRNIYDENTTGEIYFTLVSNCFASDGQFGYDEYELLKSYLHMDYSYEATRQILLHFFDHNDIEQVDRMITAAPQNVRIAVSELCISAAAIDGTITVEEKNWCMKYLVMSFNK